MAQASDLHDHERLKWDVYYTGQPLIAESSPMQAFNTELAELVAELLPAESTVLEAGCGGGWQSLGLARAKFQVTLLDFSPAALNYSTRLFERAQMPGRFMLGDVFATASPEFDLVFNAGSLEHYAFEDQVKYVRGMASRSHKYVLALVPNRFCYWYWVWRLHQSAQGQWEFGKEIPLSDLTQIFQTAGLTMLGHTFVGASWAEHFITSLAGIEDSLRNEILQLHRSPIIPSAQKSFLVAALATTNPADSPVALRWQAPLVTHSESAQTNATWADTLALAIAAEYRAARAEQAMRRAVAELDQMSASRTWKLARTLTRVYDVLRKTFTRSDK